MAKKYKGFKGSGMRETGSPKYETDRFVKQISKMLLKKIMPSQFLYEYDDTYYNS